jgi:two-component system, response regulator RegA
MSSDPNSPQPRSAPSPNPFGEPPVPRSKPEPPESLAASPVSTPAVQPTTRLSAASAPDEDVLSDVDGDDRLAPSTGAIEPGSLLLVDDDVVLRERLARALRDRGFEVRVAGGFDEALALAQDESPEYAVVDLRMPGKSGLELVKALHEVDPHTRTLVLTGYGSISTAVDAIRMGAVNFLPKPADADDLLAAFQKSDQDDLSASTDDYRAPSLARAEWEHIQRVLRDSGGNISETARRLGIHRRSLQRKLQRDAPEP